MKTNKLTIGLFGFGCVGSGLYEVLSKTPTLNAEIKRICIRDINKQRTAPSSLFTTDKNELLNDPEINVIVELIDDAKAALTIITTSLQKRKAIVSANKKAIAEILPLLLDLQKKFSTPFLYEAACCASIPVIRNLEEYYDNDLLQSIEGIINGSTNYILTKTAEEKVSYEVALKTAQEKGFAESDPYLDVSGQDAANKLVILIAHAFGTVVTPDDILTIGIDKLRNIDHQYAREKGVRIKLVARAWRTGTDRISALVIPQFVDGGNWLYSVNNEFNGLVTRNTFSDTQFFVGKGAGSHPTASAVLSDLSALRYDYKYEYKKRGSSNPLLSEQGILLKVFCSFDETLTDRVHSAFSEVEESYSSNGNGYVTGTILLDSLQAIANDQTRCSFVLLEVAEGESESLFTANTPELVAVA